MWLFQRLGRETFRDFERAMKDDAWYFGQAAPKELTFSVNYLSRCWRAVDEMRTVGTGKAKAEAKESLGERHQRTPPARSPSRRVFRAAISFRRGAHRWPCFAPRRGLEFRGWGRKAPAAATKERSEAVVAGSAVGKFSSINLRYFGTYTPQNPLNICIIFISPRDVTKKQIRKFSIYIFAFG